MVEKAVDKYTNYLGKRSTIQSSIPLLKESKRYPYSVNVYMHLGKRSTNQSSIPLLKESKRYPYSVNVYMHLGKRSTIQ